MAAVALWGGCGDDEGEGPETAAAPATDPGAVEASPEAEPTVEVESEGLEPSDRELVVAAVRDHVAALNHGDGAAVCSLVASIPRGELPRRDGGCPAAVSTSIGHRRGGGTPAWERTTIEELRAVSVERDLARVTAAVTHDFADRSQVSVEDDVVYLERAGERWLLAKPSGSFYRAVGYPEPPLRALTPP